MWRTFGQVCVEIGQVMASGGPVADRALSGLCRYLDADWVSALWIASTAAADGCVVRDQCRHVVGSGAELPVCANGYAGTDSAHGRCALISHELADDRAVAALEDVPGRVVVVEQHAILERIGLAEHPASAEPVLYGLRRGQDAARVLVRIGRSRGQRHFTDAERHLLEAAIGGVPIFDPAAERIESKTQRVDPSLVAQLTRRQKQTLRYLLGGESEKQVAARLGISPHTLHNYVKRLYRLFEVSSRGALLARFIHESGDLLNEADETEAPVAVA